MDSVLAACRAALARDGRIVALTGAGVSAESGIPTFRDAQGGLWHNYRIADVASREGWRRDKAVVLDFYAERTRNIRACQPNAAHQALALLQQKYRVVNITQNIDDLLERAGCTDVWHLHGSINHRKCEWHHSIGALEESGLTVRLPDWCRACRRSEPRGHRWSSRRLRFPCGYR